jgi:hypothetical protein
MQIYQRAEAGNYVATTMPIAGGGGSIAVARLTSYARSAIIAANHDVGSITIYFRIDLQSNSIIFN